MAATNWDERPIDWDYRGVRSCHRNEWANNHLMHVSWVPPDWCHLNDVTAHCPSAIGCLSVYSIYRGSQFQWHPWEQPNSVTLREWLILCHCNQLKFTVDWEIGTLEKCPCNQMALYCVNVTDWACIRYPTDASFLTIKPVNWRASVVGDRPDHQIFFGLLSGLVVFYCLGHYRVRKKLRWSGLVGDHVPSTQPNRCTAHRQGNTAT